MVNTTGNSNTAIGIEALLENDTGSGNVALGYQAGYHETASNKLYIANSSTTTPLIYGDFATQELAINGSLNIDKSTGGDILRLKRTNSVPLDIELSLGTSTPYSYINSGGTTTWPGGMPLVFQSGGFNVATCHPKLNTPYPSSFDLTSEKLIIGGVEGTAGQVVQAKEMD